MELIGLIASVDHFSKVEIKKKSSQKGSFNVPKITQGSAGGVRPAPVCLGEPLSLRYILVV